MSVYKFLLSAISLLLTTSLVSADTVIPKHPPPEDHWYDNACCSNKDCRPIIPGEVKMIDGVIVVTYTGEIFGPRDTRVMPSKDGRIHICKVGGAAKTRSKTICIYWPPMM